MIDVYVVDEIDIVSYIIADNYYFFIAAIIIFVIVAKNTFLLLKFDFSFVKMYIQEIIVDGLKSYAQKNMIIAGWGDPQFNASITGLNGIGKSNILDSICFVLGISALNQVKDSIT